MAVVTDPMHADGSAAFEAAKGSLFEDLNAKMREAGRWPTDYEAPTLTMSEPDKAGMVTLKAEAALKDRVAEAVRYR